MNLIANTIDHAPEQLLKSTDNSNILSLRREESNAPLLVKNILFKPNRGEKQQTQSKTMPPFTSGSQEVSKVSFRGFNEGEYTTSYRHYQLKPNLFEQIIKERSESNPTHAKIAQNTSGINLSHGNETLCTKNINFMEF